MDIPQLIATLSDPAVYPGRVTEVEVRQTHISVVFLAGSHVYKIKKPVDFGWIDFSTLEKRRHFCEEEVRLNRRLAPDVYLGVVPLARRNGVLRLEGDGETIDWAVKMQRLPDEATLQERLKRGEVTPELVESLAHRLASFHRDGKRNEHIANFGRYDCVARILLDILEQSRPQIGRTVSQTVFARLEHLTHSTLERQRRLIEARAERGMTCETHGDLHLDHIYYFPGQEPPDDLIIIDCIEFNERFRNIDPVADMAFSVMDLIYHGRRDLARFFVDAYFLACGNQEGRALLPMYTAYRASVRGSVEGLKLMEKEISESERQTELQHARAHWLLALSELEEPEQKPCLILVGGLPGTGKSTLARGLATRSPFSIIRSDVIRKELAGRPGAKPPAADGIYSAEWTEQTYRECMDRASEMLFAGKRVIVDATFRKEHHRQAFLDLARKVSVPGLLLLCEAQPETVRQRLDQRKTEISDADWQVYSQLREQWEKPGSDPQHVIHPIDTNRGEESSFHQAMLALKTSDLG